LTFDFPAAAMALTPDLLALPFHLLAVGALAAGQPLLAGVFCGVGLGFNSKAIFILLICSALALVGNAPDPGGVRAARRLPGGLDGRAG